MSSIGFPDGQRITQWLGAPIVTATALAIGNVLHTDGPYNLASWASVVVAIKPTGGNVTVTVRQQINGGPPGLTLPTTFVVPAGQTFFESVVLFGDTVFIDLTGANAGVTVDYAVYPSNTTTNAQVLATATLNFQKNEVLIAAEPTVDFVDGAGIAWTLTDDPANTRMKVAAALAGFRTAGLLLVSNTIALTSIFSGSVAAGIMGTTGRLRVRVLCRYANVTAGPQALRIAISLGATVLWDGTVQVNLEAAAVGRPMVIEFDVVNLGVTNSQYMEGRIAIGDYNTVPAVGEGSMQGATSNVNTLMRVHEIGANASSPPAIDTTVAQNLNVAIQHGAASANLELRRFYGQAEIL